MNRRNILTAIASLFTLPMLGESARIVYPDQEWDLCWSGKPWITAHVFPCGLIRVFGANAPFEEWPSTVGENGWFTFRGPHDSSTKLRRFGCALEVEYLLFREMA